MNFYSEAINRYCDIHSADEGELLHQLERHTFLEAPMPQMLSGKLQGRFLSLLSKLKSPKYVLELGTYTGYSALCLAEGLINGGELHSIDNDSRYDSLLQRFLKNSLFADRIILHKGNCLDIISTLNYSWDLVFIDADKIEYIDYLNLLEPKLQKGAMVISDNILWHGKVLEDKKDKETQALVDYIQYVNSSPLWENILLPLRDGLSVAIKK